MSTDAIVMLKEAHTRVQKLFREFERRGKCCRMRHEPYGMSGSPMSAPSSATPANSHAT
jgi:hypothetical protein